MLHLILISFVFCFVLERLNPGWKLPKVRTWPLRVLLVNAVQLGVVLLAGISWEKWLSRWSLFDLSDLNPWIGGGFAYFIATFIFYWWHRWRHESDFLWRAFHQIHHSPQRLEVITSFYKHPLEMIVNSVIGSLLVYSLLGLSLEAAGIYTLFTALGEFFYHTNVTTPRWVGYFFQRPEMHRIHHESDRHKNNYGDITWWDMMFGTWENPEKFDKTCGFTTKRELKLAQMLQFKDVHKSVLIALIAAMGLGSQNLWACSVFAAKTTAGEQLVAKNFDWVNGDGFVVINERNRKRQVFGADQPREWVAKYGSVSLTNFGPGFPISGMNERGLVVETLLDLEQKPAQEINESMMNLQWVQYQLDNFQSTKEVVAYTKRDGVKQYLLGVHFFVCDQKGNCAVIEGDGNRIEITTGKDLKSPVLANKRWQKDYAARSSLIAKFRPSFSSSKRFAVLAETLANQTLAKPADAFGWLNQSYIPALIQWQIVWNQEKKQMQWRRFRGQSPQTLYTIDFSEQNFRCSSKLRVAPLTKKGALQFRSYLQTDADEMVPRLKFVLGARGVKPPKGFAEKTAAFTMINECQHSKS